jgi:hypothetical protein
MIIWSGGQTGVDRAAWDAAIACGLDQDGWVPKGRLAEDGRIPEKYRCLETDSTDYSVRTEKNLREADATLIVAFGSLTGGTLHTKQLCAKHDRPCIIADLENETQRESPRSISLRVCALNPRILNVAGPRGSFRPDVYDRALDFLSALFREIA